jgi:hypothetical protein
MKEELNSREIIRHSCRWRFDPVIASISAIAAGLLPFVILSFFCHPQADDFDAATTALRLGYFQSIAFTYVNWNSRWFSSAIMQASPLAFGSIAAYKAVPIILLALFVRALFAFVKAVMPEIKRLHEVWLCVLALLVVYISNMASVAQGFYWMPGAISYQLANIMMLFLWAHLIKILDAPAQKPSKWILALCALLLFAIIGSNQTSMVLILFMLAATLVWRFLQCRSLDRLFAGLLALAGIATALVVLAPGNSARMEHISHAINPIATIKESVMTIVRLAIDQFTSPLMLAFTLCAIPFFAAKAQNSRALRPVLNPFVLFGLWICSMLATVIPIIHLFPGWIPERLLNITCLLFDIGWFLILNETVRGLALKRTFRFAPLPGFAIAILIVLAFFSLAGKNNLKKAWVNLLSGEACQYDWELRQRYKKITGSAQGTCVVEPLSVFPSMLYFNDINADANSWPNKPYAEYFGKQAIMLSKAHK